MLTYPDITGLEEESCNWKVCLPEGSVWKSGWKEKYFHSYEEISLSWKTFETLRKQKTYIPLGEFYCNMLE